MIKLVTIFSILFSVNISYSQSIEIDKNFGRKGKIKIKKGFNHKLFYDLKDDFFYLTYSESETDNFSPKFNYYIDGVYKYDVTEGRSDKNFGFKGHSKHALNALVPKSACSRYWQSTTEKIVCINQATEKKDIMFFDKTDGSISTYPKPEDRYCYFTNFLFHDIENNRLLVEGNRKLFWYDHLGNEELVQADIIDSKESNVQFYFVGHSKDSLIILAHEFDYNPDAFSSKVKLLNVKYSKVELIDTLSYNSFPYIIKMADDRIASSVNEDTMYRFKSNILDVNEDYYNFSPELFDSLYFRPIIEDNGILYGYVNERITTKRDEYRVSDILSNKCTLMKINLITNEIIKYSISDFFNTDYLEPQMKYLGNDSFLILITFWNKKPKYCLYKVNLN